MPLGLPKWKQRSVAPSFYGGLELWLKPESLGSSGDILTWSDSSGTSNDATWPSLGDKFQVATGVLDGFKAARATDAGLEILSLANALDSSTGDLWIVADWKGAGNEDQQLLSGFDGAQNGVFTASGGAFILRDSGGGTLTDTFASGIQVHRYTWEPANGANQWFEIGGVNVHTRTSITITPIMDTIGSQLAAWEWYGDLVEVFAYMGQSRTDGEATNLYNLYLAKKYPSLSITR